MTIPTFVLNVFARPKAKPSTPFGLLGGFHELEDRTLLAGGLYADTAISHTQSSILADGLSAFSARVRPAETAEDIAQPLPYVNAALTDVADIASVVDRVASIVASYADANETGSSAGLLVALAGFEGEADGRRFAIRPATLEGGMFLGTNDEIRFSLSVTADRNLSVPLWLGPDFLPLSVTTPAPSVSATASSDISLVFGLDLRAGVSPADAFFVRPGPASSRLSVPESSLSFNGYYGLATVTATSATVSLDAIDSLHFMNPDGDGRDNLTAGELAGTEEVVSAAPSGFLAGSFPLSARVGSWATTGRPTMTVSNGDLFGAAASITYNNDFAALQAFDRVRSQDVAGALSQLPEWANGVGRLGEYSTPLSFLPGVTLGQAADLEGMVRDRLVDGVGIRDNEDPPFFDAVGLGNLLSASTGAPVSSVGPFYNPVTRDLTFRIAISKDRTGEGAVGLPTTAGVFKDLLSGGTGAYSARSEMSLTFGIRLTPLATGETLADRFFVRDASARVNISLSGSAVQTSGVLGELKLASNPGTLSGALGLGLAFRSPKTTRTTDPITYRQLFEALDKDYTTIIASAAWTGTSRLTAPHFVPTGGFLADLAGNPTVTFITPSPRTPTVVSASTDPDFATLLRFRNLKLQNILDTLDSYTAYLSRVTTTKVFGVRLPGVDKAITRLMDPVTRFSAAVDRFRKNPPAVLNELAAKLTTAIGGEIGGVPVTVDFTPQGVLRFKFAYGYAVAEDTPLSLNLKQVGLALPGIVGIGADGKLSFAGRLDLNLDLGVDVSNPSKPTPVVFDTTKLVITGRVTGENDSVSVQLGPLELTARASSVLLDKDGDPATTDPAVFTASLKPTASGRYALGGLGTTILSAKLDGKAAIALPLFQGDNAAGVLSLTVSDLTDPARSVRFLAPNTFLAALLKDSGTLDHLDAVVDGVDRLFRSLDEGVNNWLFKRLPLVGRSLPNVTKLFASVRARLADELDKLQEKTPEAVRKALYRALGPDGLKVLLDSNDDKKITIDDLSMKVTSTDKSYRMRLGAADILLQGLKLDLGLPSLGLTINGQVLASLDWELATGFGISKTLGFYIDTTGDRDLTLGVTVTTPGLNAVGKLNFLRATVKDDPAAPTKFFGQIRANLTDPSGDNKLTLPELTGGDFSFSKNLPAYLAGGMDASLLLTADLGSDDSLSLSSTLSANWNFSSALIGTQWEKFGAAPVVKFNDVKLHLGKFLSGLVAPVLAKIDAILAPARPVVKILTEPVPVLSHFFGDDFTFMTLLGLSPAEQRAVRVIDSLGRLNDRVKALAAGDAVINLGSFRVLGDDPRTEGDLAAATPTATGAPPSDWKEQVSSGPVSTFLDDVTKIEGTQDGYGLKFPLLTDRFSAFKLLLGQDVSLFTYRMAPLVASAGYSKFIPLIGPLGARFSGGVSVSVQLSVGYDTYGIRQGNPLQGFYIDPAATGVRFAAGISAGAEVNVIIIRAGVSGGVFADAFFTPRDPNHDGKVRGDEIASNLRDGLLGLFDVSGAVTARFSAYARIGVWPFRKKWTLTIAEKTLYKFQSSYQSPAYFADLGESKLAAGDLVGAKTALQKAIAGDSRLTRAWNALGRTYEAMGQTDEAVYAYSRGVGTDPANLEGRLALGRLALARGLTEDGIYAYSSALGIDPDYRQAWLAVARARHGQGRLEDALYGYSRALGLDQDDAETWSAVGEVNSRLGRTDDAIYGYSRAVGLDPSRTDDWLAIASLTFAAGRHDECVYALLMCRQNGGTVPDNMFPPATIADVVAYVAACQLPNGAIAGSTGPSGREYDGTPYYMADGYFASLAVMGLLQAPDGPVDRFAVSRAYFRWWLANVETDGVMRTHWYYADGRVKQASTTPDAEDSNAATFLSALRLYYELTGDSAFFHEPGVRAKLESVVGVLLRLQQDNGLTFASAAYPVAFLADNAESFRGMVDAAWLFTNVFADQEAGQTYAESAERIRAGIMGILYNPATKLFHIAAFEDGSVWAVDFDHWYSNEGISALIVWPAMFGVINPSSDIARFQQDALSSHWNGSTDHPDWTTRTDWAANAYAALIVGEQADARAHLDTVIQGPFPTPFGSPGAIATVGDFGWSLRTLATAAEDDTSASNGSTVNIAVLANDQDLDMSTSGLVVTVGTGPADGVVEVLADGTIQYTPRTGFVGRDTFTYVVTNRRGMKSVASVTVAVS